MRTRILASVAVAAAVALGATGCEFMTTPDTQHIKDITDGINVNVGKLNVRNALLVSTKSGRNARFVATIVNGTNSDEDLTIQAKDSTSHEATVSVPANSTVNLATDAQQVVFEGVHVTPGDLTKVYFTYPSATGATAGIPVLTGAMAEYATLVPTTTPSPSDLPTGIATSTATATATPKG